MCFKMIRRRNERIQPRGDRAPEAAGSIVGLLLLLAVGVSRGSEPPGLGTVIQFNLVCSTCHEGECSGRFSFSSGPQAAMRHIQRYAGSLDAVTEGHLYDLLGRMKLDCSYYPMSPPSGAPGPWGKDALLPYRHAAANGYFIPLGDLKKGAHQLSLRFEQPVAVRVEVVSDAFEPLWDASWDSCGVSVETGLLVESPGVHFLRLRSAGELPIFLEQVSIDAPSQGTGPR